jgi:hypothetical protein
MSIIEYFRTISPSGDERQAASCELATPAACLAEAVQNAVEATDEERLTPLAADFCGEAYPRRFVLGVLTQCYARQIYSSGEVREFLRREAAFVGIDPEPSPEAESISRFRVENRDVIRECLVAALTHLAERKKSAGIITRINQAHVIEEASRRLTIAAFIDGMDLPMERAVPALDEEYTLG